MIVRIAVAYSTLIGGCTSTYYREPSANKLDAKTVDIHVDVDVIVTELPGLLQETEAEKRLRYAAGE
ncbi:MAG: hypothetical protein ACI9G1_000376 [Pirellulaceae bacterium]|jgi:hypothetical protein